MSSAQVKTERDYSLDVLKGIGILFVIWGHTSRNSGLISSFHMPLFFIAVGAAYVYSHNKWEWGRKMKSLLVPYFFFSVISFFYWYLVELRVRPVHEVDFYHFLDMGAVGKQFVNIFLAFDFEYAFAYDVVLWFIPCLAVSHILFCTIFKYIRSDSVQGVVSLIICPGIYYLCIHPWSVRLPFCTELALLAVPFVYIGFMAYKSQRFKDFIERYYWWILLALIFLFAVLYGWGVSGVGFYNHIIPPFYEYYLAPVIGTFIVYLIAKKCSSIRFLCYLGRNSLLLMCVHEPIKRVVIKLASAVTRQDTEAVRENYMSCLIVLIVIVLISIPIIELVNRKFSFILGKSN
ncbi:acyltransferase family protein [Bacteroides congonensis]